MPVLIKRGRGGVKQEARGSEVYTTAGSLPAHQELFRPQLLPGVRPGPVLPRSWARIARRGAAEQSGPFSRRRVKRRAGCVTVTHSWGRVGSAQPQILFIE